jgi:hypothetical protein
VGFKVNVSEQEQQSGDREPLPAGKYHVAITDVQETTPKEGANEGKPMLLFEFTVQESPDTNVPGQEAKAFHNRKIFTNACLWDGALYTIVGIYKALDEYTSHFDPSTGGLDVEDDPAFYLGRQLFVRMSENRKQKEKFPDRPDYWVQASGFSPYQAGGSGRPAAARRQEADSLLP